MRKVVLEFLPGHCTTFFCTFISLINGTIGQQQQQVKKVYHTSYIFRLVPCNNPRSSVRKKKLSISTGSIEHKATIGTHCCHCTYKFNHVTYHTTDRPSVRKLKMNYRFTWGGKKRLFVTIKLAIFLLVIFSSFPQLRYDHNKKQNTFHYFNIATRSAAACRARQCDMYYLIFFFLSSCCCGAGREVLLHFPPRLPRAL